MTAHPAPVYTVNNYAELRKKYAVIPIVNNHIHTEDAAFALVLRMAIWCVSGTSAVRF